MLDRKLDNITKVILANHDSTINQAVTPRVMSVADCGEWKVSEISRNYLITGSANNKPERTKSL
jgi:hypothetical protein